MKRNRNIGAILLIAAGLLLIAAALYELIPALLAYKRADDTYEALREAYVTGQPGHLRMIRRRRERSCRHGMRHCRWILRR